MKLVNKQITLLHSVDWPSSTFTIPSTDNKIVFKFSDALCRPPSQHTPLLHVSGTPPPLKVRLAYTDLLKTSPSNPGKRMRFF